ncbi:hypothetical protein [Flavobacterium pedocola]
MNGKFLIFTLLFFVNLFSQNCHTEILKEGKADSKNLLAAFQKENFSGLWLKTDNQNIYGVIGKNNRRLLIKFISIKKNELNSQEYYIVGKSSVNGNNCDFKGMITLQEIKEVKNAGFGVDNEYQGKIKNQYLLTAEYVFYEIRGQKNAGAFKGKLETKFYTDNDNSIKYNDIGIAADGYFNNGFTGTWKSYAANKILKCNWGDYRVPNSDCDFDIGAGEFSVSEKYQMNGWQKKPKANWWK